MTETIARNDTATGHHRAAMAKGSSYPERARKWWDQLSVYWKRRIIVMGVLAILIAVPLTIVVRNGGDETASTAPPPAAVKLHPKPVRDSDLGLSVRVPDGWSASRKQGTVVLTSGDQAARLVFGSPAAEGERAAVLGAVLGGIRSHYKNVTIKHGKGTQRIGGVRMEDAVVAAKTDSGAAIGIHVAAGSGKHHTYLIESTTGANAPATRLAEGQAAINTLKLSG